MDEEKEEAKAEKKKREFTYEFRDPKQMVITKMGTFKGRLTQQQIEWLLSHNLGKYLKKVYL